MLYNIGMSNTNNNDDKPAQVMGHFVFNGSADSHTFGPTVSFSEPAIVFNVDTSDQVLDKIKIYNKRRQNARDVNVSTRLTSEEYERLRLRALMLRTDVSKLIRSRLDDIISAEHVCEVCRKSLDAKVVEPESDGNLFDQS